MKPRRIKDQNREYWQTQVRAQATSGLSQREYCRQNSLSYWTFNSWKRRSEKEERRLYEVSPEIVRGLPGRNRQIELMVNEDIKISVPDGFSHDTLRGILQTLGVVQ